MYSMRRAFSQITQSKFFPLLAVVPLTVYGLYRRVRFRATHELWADELYQLEICKRPFWEFLRELPKYDDCRYLNGDYILTYPLFKMFGLNKWGLAVPHMIMTVLGFYILYLICRRKFTTIWGYLIAFALFSFNSTLIRHALEIRPYGFLAGLTLILYYVVDLALDQSVRFSKMQMWGIGALFVCTIWYHPYGILMLALITLFLLLAQSDSIRKFQDSVKRIFPLYSMALLIAMPLWLYSFFGHPVEGMAGGVDTFQYYPNPLIDPAGFFKTLFCNFIGYKLFYPLILGLPLAFLLPHKDREKQIGFFLIMVILPVQILLLLVLHNHYWFVQRQLIWIMPLFALLLGWCWEASICHIFGKFKSKTASTAA